VSELLFEVPGQPQPQGSMKAYVRRGKAVLLPDNESTRAWRLDVVLCARQAIGKAGCKSPMFTGPVAVNAVFTLRRPPSVRRAEPCTRPDLDKLTRALLDSLTMAGAWRDDGQVTDLAVRKRYAGPETSPGAAIRVAVWRARPEPRRLCQRPTIAGKGQCGG
jgi:Holliday junction resolvase RusA-like endonuclease